MRNPLDRRNFLSAALLLGGTSLGLAVDAQSRYPAQPISLIVPFPPGGVADIVARTIAARIQQRLGLPAVVVNRPGAGGAIGAALVANGKPDGYSLLVALTSLSTNPEQELLNNRPVPFQLRQLAPVARLSSEDMMLAVPAASRYHSLAEIVGDARARPGIVSYASSGNYGVYHIATEVFVDAAKIHLSHIPYSGGAPAMLALVSGQVDLGLVTRSVGLAQLRSGKVRPVAAWGESRWEEFPDVPTVIESGYNVNYTLWSGLFVQANTPRETVNALRMAVAAAVADPDFRSAMKNQGVRLAYLDGPEFAKVWEAESAQLIKTVRRIGKLQ
ncbi:MAG: tripartite tricarboxylate transporter substrate binding protein [Pseudomonadota bacterium]|nr:tripartite tricarboxylate transporter substrate binding protein [Pseudomonadota bacterium]